MQKLKPYKTVEQIAKKHRLEVSFIQKQLDMGEPIEHEHTKDHKLATEIALQHLDEIPDYYTRLKKMETSAKKEHKKFKDVTEGKGLWANIHARRKAGKPAKKPGEKGYPKTLDIPEQVDMQRYCPRCEKNETRDACKYGPKYWDMFSTPISLSSNAYDPNRPHPANEEKDHEYSMARSEISTIIAAAKRLKKKMGKGEGSLEAWVQSKITKAADYLDSAADYVNSGEMKAESKSFVVGSDHTRVRTTNASKKLQTMSTAQQAQLPKEKVKKVLGTDLPRFNKEETSVDEGYRNIARKAGVMTKQAAKAGVTAGGAQIGARALRSGGVRNAIRNKIGLSSKQRNHPGADQLDATAKKARRRAATIAAVQASHKPGVAQDQEAINRKRGVEKNREKIEKAYNQSESVTIEDAKGNHYVEFIDIIKPEPLKPSKGIGSDMLGEKCWDGYTQKGMKKKGKKMVPNCVPEGKTFSSFIDEAKKSEMKCNSPKSEPVGDSLTGKSHVVKACSGGKEKLIRFGQRGVKGSPKKKGESKAYASRRNRFQTRHAKNIAKGKMSAAYWSNLVKW